MNSGRYLKQSVQRDPCSLVGTTHSILTCSAREHGVPRETGRGWRQRVRGKAAAGGMFEEARQREDTEGRFLVTITQLQRFVFPLLVFSEQ